MNFRYPSRVEGVSLIAYPPRDRSMNGIIVLALSCMAFAGFAQAADEVPDWSKFTKHSVVKGVIVSAEADKITVEVPTVKKSNAGSNRRPSVKAGHEHVDISYAPAGLVRWEKMPSKPDGSKPTAKDLEDLRKPVGAPGYAAAKGDLKPGHIVELTLVHPRDIPADKVKEADIVIKYVMIEGETKAPKEEPKKKKN
jgi:hypothetical protein